MPRITIIARDRQATARDAAEGMSVMELVRDAGRDELLALRGGCCSCATCHAHVEGEVDPGPPVEDGLLDSSDHRTARSRRSCQIAVDASLDGLAVRIAPED